jgi:hypothetical protein
MSLQTHEEGPALTLPTVNTEIFCDGQFGAENTLRQLFKAIPLFILLIFV